MSNLYEDNPHHPAADIRTGTNAAGAYNPPLNFAPQNQNSVDSMHSLKQTLAHTLQNLHSSSVGAANSPPENAYHSFQNHDVAAGRQVDTSHSYNARPSMSQSQYDNEPSTEALYSRNMQPPTNLHSTHLGHLASNRLPHTAPVDAYHSSNKFDSRISAAVAPVPGDVRYQAPQQAHSAHQSGPSTTLYHPSVVNRVMADRNSSTFAPSIVPRIAQGAQPQLSASAYYNRRPESAHVSVPIQSAEGRDNYNPRANMGTGGQG